jgi:hypothetical protein
MELAHLDCLMQGLLRYMVNYQLSKPWRNRRSGGLVVETQPAALAAQFYFSTDNHELRNHQLHWPCR